MKRFFILLALALAWCGRDGLRAQTPPGNSLSLTGPATALPGSTINIALNLAETPGPAALEFLLSTATPMDISNMTATLGPVATAAGKQLQCAPFSAAAANTGSLHCLIFSPAAATAIAPGVVANIAVQLAAAPAQKLETFTLIQPEVSASPAGAAVTVTIGPPFLAALSNPCDLNGDATVNTVDTLLEVAWVLGGIPPTGFHCDLNGDGKCDALDVQMVANAAAGGLCTGK